MLENSQQMRDTSPALRQPDKFSNAQLINLSRQASKLIMKENQNLDLSKYNKFLSEFQQYSANLFDFGDNMLFKPQEKTTDEIIKEKLQRSTKNEYIKTENQLKIKFDN